MSAQTALQVEDILNIIRPNRYFAIWRWREGDKLEYAVVEPDDALMALPGTLKAVVYVKASPLNIQPPQDMSHPRIRWIQTTVGYPPALKVYQYTLIPIKLRLIQRLETGAEFYMPTQEQDDASPPITIHTVNAYYTVYRSNSGKLYGRGGGIKAYRLAERGVLQPPHAYIMRLDKHKFEIGVRVPLSTEQVRQLYELVGSAAP